MLFGAKTLGVRLPVVGMLAWMLVTVGSGLRPAAAEDRLDYNRDIRPILSNNCFKCHGPDAQERQANLRLDVRESAVATMDSGKVAIVPGKSAESELLKRITSTDADAVMPPPATGKKLSAAEIATLQKWIDQGAEFLPHWAFLAPRKLPLPAVKREPLVRNPIDRFILARVEAAGLEPSPEADKITLLRRVTLDLTGLPPTIEEVDAFLADTSPDAYDKVVARLFKSPRHGEHMARYWLDAARYGDTHGLHLDNERSMWPYRDWVIRAYNENMPFDRFTIEQMAGDLLPEPTLEQRVATGFHRCNVTTSEGGSIDEEVRVRNAVDRVETTSTVFLGLTLGCAVCHDHKFDPVSQKEFYQLFAYFGAVNEGALDGNALLPPPSVKIPIPFELKKIEMLREQVAQTQKQIADELAKVQYEEPAGPAPSAEPQEFVWIDDALPSGANAQGNTPWEFVAAPAPVHSGAKSHVRKAAGLSQHFFTDAKPGLAVGEGDKFFAYVYLDPQNPPKEIMMQWNDGSWEHRAIWGENVIEWGAHNTPSRQPMGPLPKAGEWVRLEVEIAKVGIAPGATINGWAFTQFDGAVYWDKAGIVTRTPQNGQQFESLAAWEAVARADKKLALPGPVRQAIDADPAKRNDEQKKLIREHFLARVYSRTRSLFDPLLKQVEETEKQIQKLEGDMPSTLVMQDKNQPREAFVLKRGEYDKRLDKVSAGVPAALPPLPEGAPANRLGLAQWLVAAEHPLTARVTVNRYWQQFFGTGIVKTAEDFGSQGEWPSHPELLDWLAVEFRESGWNTRHILTLIVTSHTYRQASRATPQHLEKDRDNRLLARGPRFRVDAEVVRDTALFASGLLVEKVGGKSVKPYQPEGIWEAVAFTSSNTSKFKQDSGEALYRRSMYTFWKRTSPPPSLQALDAPSREVCTVRRARTNTPLQALALLNDKQYVEAARHLAALTMKHGGATPEARIAYAFRRATSRPPREAETAALKKLYEAELAEYQANAAAAQKLLSYGDSPADAALPPAEYAAWTMVANVILNLDETMTKE